MSSSSCSSDDEDNSLINKYEVYMKRKSVFSPHNGFHLSPSRTRNSIPSQPEEQDSILAQWTLFYQQKERYFLSSKAVPISGLEKRRAQSPGHRLEELMYELKKEETNKKHYRRNSCKCARMCGNAGNSKIQMANTYCPFMVVKEHINQLIKKKKHLQNERRRQSQMLQLESLKAAQRKSESRSESRKSVAKLGKKQNPFIQFGQMPSVLGPTQQPSQQQGAARLEKKGTLELENAQDLLIQQEQFLMSSSRKSDLQENKDPNTQGETSETQQQGQNGSLSSVSSFMSQPVLREGLMKNLLRNFGNIEEEDHQAAQVQQQHSQELEKKKNLQEIKQQNFKRLKNLINTTKSMKKLKEKEDEMGEDYYRILDIMHNEEDVEEKLQEYLEKEEEQQDNQFLYRINSHHVMKLPKVNNHMTRCFVDMYRFRPNATINNYVVTQEKGKKGPREPTPSFYLGSSGEGFYFSPKVLSTEQNTKVIRHTQDLPIVQQLSEIFDIKNKNQKIQVDVDSFFSTKFSYRFPPPQSSLQQSVQHFPMQVQQQRSQTSQTKVRNNLSQSSSRVPPTGFGVGNNSASASSNGNPVLEGSKKQNLFRVKSIDIDDQKTQLNILSNRKQFILSAYNKKKPVSSNQKNLSLNNYAAQANVLPSPNTSNLNQNGAQKPQELTLELDAKPKTASSFSRKKYAFSPNISSNNPERSNKSNLNSPKIQNEPKKFFHIPFSFYK